MIEQTRKTLSGKRVPVDRDPTPYQVAILTGLNLTGKHIYAGTASPRAVMRRRAARKARR